MKKIKKIVKYLKFRLYEFRVSCKEFSKGGKLNREIYRKFQDSSILVLAHSVEKGLGLRNAGPGHSGKIVNNLLNKLLVMVHDNDLKTQFPFKETLRIIIAYLEFQEQFDTTHFNMYTNLKKKYDELKKILGEDYIRHLVNGLDAGAEVLDADYLLGGKNFDFMTFIETRHSIRSYKKEAIPEDLIKEAVRIANKAPSACNRQPSYVYFCNDHEKVDQIDGLITGSSGFKGEVPNYVVVTTDRAYFSYVEQYQWYINGGIYLSYLSLALHSLGVGHCIMQWKAFYKTEEELKQLFGISSSEAIIAIVGCGYYSDEVSCIKAQRKDVEDTLRVVR